MGSPSSRMPSRCRRIASRMRSSISVWVAPVATQPGKSGENAEKLVGVFSMMIRYLVCMHLFLESGLSQDAVECARRHIVLGLSCNGHPSCFGRMFVLAMAPFFGDHDPAVDFNDTKNFSNSYDFLSCLPRCIRLSYVNVWVTAFRWFAEQWRA